MWMPSPERSGGSGRCYCLSVQEKVDWMGSITKKLATVFHLDRSHLCLTINIQYKRGCAVVNVRRRKGAVPRPYSSVFGLFTAFHSVPVHVDSRLSLCWMKSYRTLFALVFHTLSHLLLLRSRQLRYSCFVLHRK